MPSADVPLMTPATIISFLVIPAAAERSRRSPIDSTLPAASARQIPTASVRAFRQPHQTELSFCAICFRTSSLTPEHAVPTHGHAEQTWDRVLRTLLSLQKPARCNPRDGRSNTNLRRRERSQRRIAPLGPPREPRPFPDRPTRSHCDSRYARAGCL